MTPNEVRAFNAGVAAVTALASQAAQAMRSREKLAPTRYPFATEALQAIADEAAAFTLPMLADHPEGKSS